MGRVPPFDFRSAPDLPGPDRLTRCVSWSLRTMTHRLWNFEVAGIHHVPTDGPAIIASNHLSFCDSIFVPSALPRRAWGIGKSEYMDSWKTKHIVPAMGMIPVDRSGGDAAESALDIAAEVLGQGHLFVVYPEGTRSRSGDLHKGRTGAARLALRCDAPIIPLGHRGTADVQPPGSALLRPFKRVTVRCGAPMAAGDYGDPADPRTPRRFTDAVMQKISELSGQTYVDEYADNSPT